MFCNSYVIKKGDTLYNISRQLGVSIDDIMKANPLVNVYHLIVDEVICIPMNTEMNHSVEATPYIVAEGDTLQSILNSNYIYISDFMNVNEPKDIYLLPGSTVNIPSTGEGEFGPSL